MPAFETPLQGYRDYFYSIAGNMPDDYHYFIKKERWHNDSIKSEAHFTLVGEATIAARAAIDVMSAIVQPEPTPDSPESQKPAAKTRRKKSG